MLRLLNGPQLIRAFQLMKTKPIERVKKDTPKVARKVAAEAKRRAQSRPRQQRTGHIAASIITDRDLVRVTADDARVQEFGGRAPLFGNRSHWFQVRAPSRDGHFLGPAVRESEPQVFDTFVDAIDDSIRSIWNR